MSWGEPRSYRSDDRDLEQCDYRLDVSMGENGDWYLCIVRSDKKSSWEHVRITTSGSKRPEVANAIADLYRALGDSARDHVWVYDDANGQTSKLCGEIVGTKNACTPRLGVVR